MIDPTPGVAVLEGGSLLRESLRILDLVASWDVVHLRAHGIAMERLDDGCAGPLIRGALGASLHRLAGREAGGACRLREDTAYSTLFEPRTARCPGERGSPVRPFAIVAPERVEPGPLTFEVKLFGLPHAWRAVVVEALLEMGREGIGRDRVRIPLEGIESLAPPSFPAEPDAAPCRVVLRLLSPFRARDGSRSTSALEPPALIRAVLGRLGGLGVGMGQVWPDRWPALMEAAKGMVVVRREVRRVERGRFSRRQGRAVRLGGMVGEMEYDRVPRVLIPILRAGAFAHPGKGAAFGRGAMEVRVSRLDASGKGP